MMIWMELLMMVNLIGLPEKRLINNQIYRNMLVLHLQMLNKLLVNFWICNKVLAKIEDLEDSKP